MKFLTLGIVPLVVLHISSISATKPAPIVFLIQSQPSEFHVKLAEKLKLSILNQWSQYVPSHVMTPPSVVLTHLLDEASSAWTIFPIIKVLADHMKAEETIEWAAVLAENVEKHMVIATSRVTGGHARRVGNQAGTKPSVKGGG